MHFANASALGLLLGFVARFDATEESVLRFAAVDVTLPLGEVLLIAATPAPFGELLPQPATSAAAIAEPSNRPI
jgi:hypothetical protein